MSVTRNVCVIAMTKAIHGISFRKECLLPSKLRISFVKYAMLVLELERWLAALVGFT